MSRENATDDFTDNLNRHEINVHSQYEEQAQYIQPGVNVRKRSCPAVS